MGLGKTIQAIGLILSNMPARDAGSSRCNLELAPLSVIATWNMQLKRFCKPGVLKVAIYSGSDRQKELRKVERGDIDVLLTTYETLVADFKKHSAMLEEKEEDKEMKRASKIKKAKKGCENQDAWTKQSGPYSKTYHPDYDDDSEDDYYNHRLPTSMGKCKAVTPTLWIFDIHFHRIILDEAHTIRNSDTARFKSTMLISADYKLCLTGTPYVNKLCFS